MGREFPQKFLQVRSQFRGDFAIIHCVVLLGWCNSTPNTNRARDFVVLQIVINNAKIDYAKTLSTCRRLFAYRQKQTWPPLIVKGEGWDDLYVAAKESLGVLPTVDEAISWVNDLVTKIDKAN